MSSLLQQNLIVNEVKKFDLLKSNDCFDKKHSRHILKAKENILKHKCSKALKKKLKKYKLRHDGKEDEEVLDVSNTLIRLLKIKSPNSQNKINCVHNISEFEDVRPKNYLFKMVKRKQTVKTVETQSNSDSTLLNVNEENSVSLSISEVKPTTQKNAFQLMMDSRNKSIGSNSPGKEKTIDDTESQENIDKKSVKVKRKLLLQKMAESKGALKKELEEYQEQCIKNKLEKRAERFKIMIASNGSVNSKSDKKMEKAKSKTSRKYEKAFSPRKVNNDVDYVTSSAKTLKVINIFNDSVNNVSASKKVVSKEDEEFMKKLSPSLKKKENMLCYFNKLEKVSPTTDVESIDNIDIDSVDNVDNDIIIKVKLSTRPKKKVKKRKFSLKKANTGEEIENKYNIEKVYDVTNHNIECNVDKASGSVDNERRKRKRKQDICHSTEIKVTTDSLEVRKEPNDLRPKRITKKPIKYADDIELFSSDEELQIFTPKKKKPLENKLKYTKVTKNNEPKDKVSKEIYKEISTAKVEKKLVNENTNKKKPTKLAPIFASKLQPNSADIEAKQKFLHSGVPDKLKRKINQQKETNTALSTFPTVVHVQQEVKSFASFVPLVLDLIENDFSDDLCINYEDKVFKHMIDTDRDKNINFFSTPKCNATTVLQNMKRMFPKFPVYRTYRLLKDKSRGVLKECAYLDLDNSIEVINGMVEINNDNLDKLNWSNKYRALSAKQLVGNYESIRELRKWLVTWTENQVKSKKTVVESDSSDFYLSDNDSKDSMKTSNNLLIVTGPVGSGKTTSVYAVAAELAIKVIEVNASSKRTGKIMLQDLHEATQSHKVNRGKSGLENSQKSQEVISESQNNIKSRGRPKKHSESISKKSISKYESEVLSQTDSPNSQEITRTESSLILIDDADIVFEQDDGFCSAIMQLVQCSKRPVILITSSTSCPHLQRFLQFAKIISLRPLLPRTLGIWLDLMCLADSGICLPGTGAKFLDFFKGDIRKAINSLQFYITSQVQESKTEKEPDSQNSDLILNTDDESSSMSWGDSEAQEEKHVSQNNSYDIVWKSFMRQQMSLLHIRYPTQLYNMWWSLSSRFELQSDTKGKAGKKFSKIDPKSIQRKIDLDTIAKTIEAFSVSDYCAHFTNDTAANILSQPWYSAESDSVSEIENLQAYNRNHEFIDEISHELITGYFVESQKKMESEVNYDIDFPDMAVQRSRDKTISQHNTIANYLNPSAVLDRKALALDYWSACRSICRIEKAKTDNNLKRNNRFCHYLKSLNILCKSDSFEILSNTLYTESEEC
ncbi:LOW QUALITY PROTEIN: enhanced level of genomic instability 1 [Aphomia sociella]